MLILYLRMCWFYLFSFCFSELKFQELYLLNSLLMFSTGSINAIDGLTIIITITKQVSVCCYKFAIIFFIYKFVPC